MLVSWTDRDNGLKTGVSIRSTRTPIRTLPSSHAKLQVPGGGTDIRQFGGHSKLLRLDRDPRCGLECLSTVYALGWRSSDAGATICLAKGRGTVQFGFLGSCARIKGRRCECMWASSGMSRQSLSPSGRELDFGTVRSSTKIRAS